MVHVGVNVHVQMIVFVFAFHNSPSLPELDAYSGALEQLTPKI